MVGTCGAEGVVSKGRGDKVVCPCGTERETHRSLSPEQRGTVSRGEAQEKL